MSRNVKLLDKLKNKPKDFTYDELRRLLRGFDCIECLTGITSGSRVAFIHQPTLKSLRLHRPHPGNELKAYQIKYTLDFLREIGGI